MAKIDVRVRFGIIFKVDGLDLEGVKEDLSKDVTVTEVLDDTLVEDNEPVKVILCDGEFAKYLAVKLRYNCWNDPHQHYLLWPMQIGA